MRKKIWFVVCCSLAALGLLAVAAIRVRNANNSIKTNPNKIVVIDGIEYHAQVVDAPGEGQIMFFIERTDLEGAELFD